MKKYSDLEYLKLSKWERFKYRFVSFFASIPVAIWHAILGIGNWFKKAGLAIANELKLPVKYVGVGEGIDDLIPFDAKSFVEALFK